MTSVVDDNSGFLPLMYVCLRRTISLTIYIYIYITDNCWYCLCCCRRGLNPPHRVKSISMASFSA